MNKKMNLKSPSNRFESAVAELAPKCSYNTEGGKISEWLTPDIPQPSETDIDAKVAEYKIEWDAQEYARTRKPLYPDIGDQLDDLYKEGVFSASMAAKLKKVKDDNPKG